MRRDLAIRVVLLDDAEGVMGVRTGFIHERFWTSEQIDALRKLYEQHHGRMIPLAEFAVSIGRSRPNVCRKARQLGLTDSSRQKRPPRKVHAPKHATDEARRAAIGQATRNYIATNGHPRGSLGMKHSEETKRRVAAASRRKWESITPEELQVRSEKAMGTRIARYGTGGQGVRSENAFSRCKGGKREDLGGQYFRSSWEANWARFLNFQVEHDLIRSWTYEPRTFLFEGVTRGVISYLPDFLVVENDGSEIYHEVKGWMTAQSKARLKRMAEFYPDVRLRLIDEPVYRQVARQISGLIPYWEGRR